MSKVFTAHAVSVDGHISGARTATGSSSSPVRACGRHATCDATLGWRCPSRRVVVIEPERQTVSVS